MSESFVNEQNGGNVLSAVYNATKENFIKASKKELRLLSELEKECIETNIEGETTETTPAGKENPSLRSVSAKELFTMEVPVREMLLAPILPRQSISMVYARAGIGKTFCSMSIALAVASGSELFGKWSAPKKRRVLYIDGEMPLGMMQDRLKLLCGALNLDEIPETLSFITPDIQDYFMPNVGTKEGQALIEPFLEDTELVILDNLATLAPSFKDNDVSGWIPIQDWLLSLRRRGITTLLVHHASKSGSARGSSAKLDVLDMSLLLKRPLDYDPSEGCRFEVHFEKSRGLAGDAVAPFDVSLVSLEPGLYTWGVKSIKDILLERVAEMLEREMSERAICEELAPEGVTRRQVQKLRAELEKQGKVFPKSKGGWNTHKRGGKSTGTLAHT